MAGGPFELRSRDGGREGMMIYLFSDVQVAWMVCCAVLCGGVRCGAAQCGAVAPVYIHGWLAVVMHVNDVAVSGDLGTLCPNRPKRVVAETH